MTWSAPSVYVDVLVSLGRSRGLMVMMRGSANLARGVGWSCLHCGASLSGVRMEHSWALGTVFLPVLFVLTMSEPVVSGFWCRDQSLRYPYKADTVPTSLLLSFTFGGPFLVMFVTEVIRAAAKIRQPKRLRSGLFSFLKGSGVFLFGMGANCLVTDCIKLSVGRHRPHFIDICKPNFDVINCTMDDGLGLDRFVEDYECTNTDVDQKLLRDSRLSFPSGHASLSVYSAVFTILYLQSRMKVSWSYLLRPTLQLGLVMLAALCCASRVRDHKHFPSDVMAGAVLGFAVAAATFIKLGCDVIPTTSPEPAISKGQPNQLERTMSYESEPQTPTPLLQPDRSVLSSHNNHSFRNDSSVKSWSKNLGKPTLSSANTNISTHIQ